MRTIKFRAWDGSSKYVAGSDGLIYSTDFNHTGKTKALKGWINEYGYPEVCMNINGKRVVGVTHRFVALAFLGKKPTPKHQVNHKNGIRNDNRPDNLEYVTHQENVIHGWRVNGRRQSQKAIENAKKQFGGVKNPKAKMTPEMVKEIKKMRINGSYLKDIAFTYKISIAQVGAICNNKFWK